MLVNGVILALLTSLTMAIPSVAGEHGIKGSTEVVPRSLSIYLRDHFPDLSILPKEEAMDEILEYFASEKIKEPSPFVCSGDFNGDGLRDFALLLRDKATGTHKLMAFHQTKKQGYIHFVVENLATASMIDLASQKIDVYITCGKPGKKRYVEGGFVIVKTDSIILGFWGKAAELYYFVGNRYSGMIISD